MEHLEEYKKHCIDQAITILTAGHDIKCMFTTPKLLESLAYGLAEQGTSIQEIGITGIFSEEPSSHRSGRDSVWKNYWVALPRMVACT